MDRKCVFCGQRPVSKTNEHVLPVWLLELTGSPKRPLQIWLPHDESVGLPKEMAFDSLKFPACKDCNGDFANLEGCGIGFLRRSASESGTLRHGDGTHGRSDRCRRSFVLPILSTWLAWCSWLPPLEPVAWWNPGLVESVPGAAAGN